MKKTPIIIGISLVLLISIGVIAFANFNRAEVKDEIILDSRPSHCIEGICADKSVFINLPKYPENLEEVALGVELNAYDLPENFSKAYPDENYYKQPEFYPDESFASQGLKYYTVSNVKWSIGSGSFPGDYVISNMENKDLISMGDTIKVVTYWHAGYGIYKYQMFKLVPTFPEYMKIRMGTYEVTQDTSEAQRCLEVKVSPENILLGKTSPSFDYDWTQKITAYITVKCPGKFAVSIMPDNVDEQFQQKMIREYGLFNISSNPSGSEWQVFLDIQ
jgi:hypothetical protein